MRKLLFFSVIVLAVNSCSMKDSNGNAPLIEDKNEREFQAYSEMLFHRNFPLVPDVSDFHKKFFAEKAVEYYKRMGENSELQQKYAAQQKEIENLISSLL